MTATIDSQRPRASEPATNAENSIPCSLPSVPVHLLGEAAGWFSLSQDANQVIVSPRKAMPRRCTIRPAAIFQHTNGWFEANIVMGRLAFPNGSTDPVTYRPFTRSVYRNLKELYFPVEAMPEDEWAGSVQRWKNHQGIAKRLLSAAGISWSGISQQEIDDLVRFVVWPESLEGCVLHALAQRYNDRGLYLLEIGSYRGCSATVLSLALRRASSDALLFSVDPHRDQPHNLEHVRLAMRQIGEETRLVQVACDSDRAANCLAKESASLVFIDGDHSYEQVRADFENYRHLVVPGGCLIFHDYDFADHNGQPALHPGVRRVVDEIVMNSVEFRPICLAHTLFAFEKR